MINSDSEIMKLMDRVAKDPKSKLFVPLAEEYRKINDIEMAVHVLKEGLQHNPGYVTAKTLLGRLLFDSDDIEGARKEFEEVVRVAPDNLLAQKKLGEVLMRQNNRPEALKHFKIAYSLNPRDMEIGMFISDLEAGVLADTAFETPSAPETPSSPPPQTVSLDQQALLNESFVLDVPDDEQLSPDSASDILDQPIADPIHEVPGIAPVDIAPEIEAESPMPDLTAAEGIQEVSAYDLPVGKPDAFDEMLVSEEGNDVAEEVVMVEPFDESDIEEAMKSLFGGSLDDDVVSAYPIVSPSIVTEIPVESPEALFESREPEIHKTQRIDAHAETDEFTTDTLAELYIAQGFYDKASDIYEKMVAADPDNALLAQKLDRLRSLMAAAEAASIQSEQDFSAFQATETSFDEGSDLLAQTESDAHFLGSSVEDLAGGALFTPDAARDSAPTPDELFAFHPDSELAGVAPSAESRQRAIARLESWLAVIRKER